MDHGQTMPVTILLYPSPANDPDGAVSTGFNYLANTRGIPRDKINIGLAFYGKQYNAIDGSYRGECHLIQSI